MTQSAPLSVPRCLAASVRQTLGRGIPAMTFNRVTILNKPKAVQKHSLQCCAPLECNDGPGICQLGVRLNRITGSATLLSHRTPDDVGQDMLMIESHNVHEANFNRIISQLDA